MADLNASKRRKFLSAGRNRSRWLLLIGGVLLCLVLFLFQGWYERRVLSGPTMRVEVLCHTQPLQREDLTVAVLYDKLALSPVARGLGLYQNRPVAEIRSFRVYQVAADKINLTPYSVELSDVPQGPIAKVYCSAGGAGYYADVTDRALHDGTLYVRVE